MSGDVPRWVFVLIFILLVLGLLIWARGLVHHHGDDVGALHGPHAAAQSL
jgi:hypothetical protein